MKKDEGTALGEMAFPATGCERLTFPRGLHRIPVLDKGLRSKDAGELARTFDRRT
jgi:hypothetical protein